MGGTSKEYWGERSDPAEPKQETPKPMDNPSPRVRGQERKWGLAFSVSSQ